MSRSLARKSADATATVAVAFAFVLFLFLLLLRMVRMVVPGTQGEWSAQSLLQSPETASVADVAEYYLGLEAYSCDVIGKFCG